MIFLIVESSLGSLMGGYSLFIIEWSAFVVILIVRLGLKWLFFGKKNKYF